MASYPYDGPWTYRSTIGGTLVLAANERLLGLRVIAMGSSGNLTVDLSTGPGEPIPITTALAFDWTPSAKVTVTTLTFSSTTLQWFAEIGLGL